MAKTIQMPTASPYTKGETTDISSEIIRTPRKEDNPRYRRMRRTSYQARLGRKLDKINNLLLDNNIRLASHPTDMLRIEVKRDERSHDLISRTIKSAEIMPILLPNLKDIPIRHLIREGSDVLIPSLYAIQEQEYFEIYSPVESELNEDDLLIRMLYESSPDISNPYIMVLQVKEILATFSYSSILYKKCLVTWYDESLPIQVVNLLKESILKREKLDW